MIVHREHVFTFNVTKNQQQKHDDRLLSMKIRSVNFCLPLIVILSYSRADRPISADDLPSALKKDEKFIPSLSEVNHCSDFMQEKFDHLGTKTPYRFVGNLNDSRLHYEGCEPLKLVGIVRHGTRTPGVKDAERIRRTLGKIQKNAFRSDDAEIKSGERLCQKEKDSLLNWNLSLESEDGKTLTHEGGKEMFSLGRRFMKRFSDFLDSIYTGANYFFKYTNTQRTEKSALSFVAGLFGEVEARKVQFPEPPLDKDPVLRFYKLCERWKVEVKNSNASKIELELFKSTEAALAMVERVSRRLGLEATLSYDEVNQMYLTCAFEVAWNSNNNVPWCSVFSLEDLLVLEYGEDLKYYWRDGYGYRVSYEQACVLTKHIFDYFRSQTNPEREAVFYFTHSGTLLKLLSHLGLYKDEFPLKHDTAQPLRERRQWRVSEIDAFGTNVVFVLFKCSNFGDLKVLTLHQENAVRIAGCPKDGDLCPMDELRQILGADDTCSFSDLCKIRADDHNRSHLQGDL
ncbi:Multiple inositol polyphosphate phosphatase [Nesidiocoris tenuis]|uniref:Multiple inositol polyphosphate phosphatase n=1 Tax=Nesidiocoris tenuis TaxID=355587 RepID=A0ABN7B3J9_9HEMI|nr:Multiple inositol polyphosphate phosphatase [Nesidiocoris tenuis]